MNTKYIYYVVEFENKDKQMFSNFNQTTNNTNMLHVIEAEKNYYKKLGFECVSLTIYPTRKLAQETSNKLNDFYKYQGRFILPVSC